MILANRKIENLPFLRINSIQIKNFKVFENYKFDFKENEILKQFICFIGPNGSGKSTVLNALQLLFANFNSLESERIFNLLGRVVRHTKEYKDNVLYDEDFTVVADFSSEFGDYQVELNRKGFVKNHPPQILDYLSRICYYTKFDQELYAFQLNRDKWDKFKEIFESITGFEIYEDESSIFSLSDDIMQSDMLKKYVISFFIKKPYETINVKECSDGEKKLIKSFSTLLNLEFLPQIILIDNVEMHIESSRHLKLIKSMKNCYPNSQIFTTTHSYHISKNFLERTQIYDMRIIHAGTVVKEQPWRLKFVDEIKDFLIKLDNMFVSQEELLCLKKDSMLMIEELETDNNLNVEQFKNKMMILFSKVYKEYINNII